MDQKLDLSRLSDDEAKARLGGDPTRLQPEEDGGGEARTATPSSPRGADTSGNLQTLRGPCSPPSPPSPLSQGPADAKRTLLSSQSSLSSSQGPGPADAKRTLLSSSPLSQGPADSKRTLLSSLSSLRDLQT
ncbi:hypothetical protein KUCAC02_037509, partial [Chaenocephalus aceratus]